MSKPRYDWWSYVKGMIRRYPALAEEYQEAHEQSVTANYSGMPRGGGEGRPLEASAIRAMSSTHWREHDAVHRAIETTERMRTGWQRLEIIRMVFWERSHHTLQGAAQKLPIGYDQAQTYHKEFIYLVARNYGLLD